LALAGASAVLFLVASGTASLYVARLLIGLGVGIASGTGTAWLADQYGQQRRATATLTAATANSAGIALGPLVGGLLARYAVAPLRLPFIAYLLALAAVAVAAARSQDIHADRRRRLRDVRIQFRLGVPRGTIRSFVPPAVTGFVIFALGGLYFALIPTIVIRDLHQTNVAVGGLIVFELGAVAVAVMLLSRRIHPPAAMASALLLLIPAVALVTTAQAVESMRLLLIAAALAGAALALGYRGSLEVVNQVAPDERRAEVVSTYYIACFAGNAVPVIGLGVLATLTDPLIASITFASTVATFGIAALAWQFRTTRSRATS
jgi:MFS family permease